MFNVSREEIVLLRMIRKCDRMISLHYSFCRHLEISFPCNLSYEKILVYLIVSFRINLILLTGCINLEHIEYRETSDPSGTAQNKGK